MRETKRKTEQARESQRERERVREREAERDRRGFQFKKSLVLAICPRNQSDRRSIDLKFLGDILKLSSTFY